MKRPSISFIIIASIIAIIVIRYPSGTWRYKMTVTVETPEGIKIGNAVREVSAYLYPTPFPEDSGAAVRLKYGEAVVVDLGKRGVLFASLFGEKLYYDYAQSLPFYVFPNADGGSTASGIRHFRRLKAGPVELEPQWYPVFVNYKDIHDRKSAEAVLEMEPCAAPDMPPSSTYSRCIKEDKFSKIYGEGVRLKSITIEMTKESVTKGVVDRYLPWLEPWRKKKTEHPYYIKQEWDGAKNSELAQRVVWMLKKEGLK